jgi:hypothetical protein
MPAIDANQASPARPEDERSPDRTGDDPEEDDRHAARTPVGSPAKTSTPERQAHPPAVTSGPAIPSTNPARITGIRPTRSETRPAGPTASAPAIRNTAGPSPRMLSTPVTATIVTVPSATASWIIPDWKTSPLASCDEPGSRLD